MFGGDRVASRQFIEPAEGGGRQPLIFIALHVDQSVKDAKEGIAYTAITAGAHKNDFSPHAPLSPEATASLQAEVDRLYAMFVGQVAVMRGIEPDAVRATEAGLYFGEQAIDAGLADAVLSLDAALSEFATYLAAVYTQRTRGDSAFR